MYFVPVSVVLVEEVIVNTVCTVECHCLDILKLDPVPYGHN